MCGKKCLENGPGMAGRRKYFDIFLVLMSCVQDSSHVLRCSPLPCCLANFESSSKDAV